MFISFLWDDQYVNAERCVFRTQPNTYGGDFLAKILAFVSSFTIEKVNRMSIFAYYCQNRPKKISLILLFLTLIKQHVGLTK